MLAEQAMATACQDHTSVGEVAELVETEGAPRCCLTLLVLAALAILWMALRTVGVAVVVLSGSAATDQRLVVMRLVEADREPDGTAPLAPALDWAARPERTPALSEVAVVLQPATDVPQTCSLLADLARPASCASLSSSTPLRRLIRLIRCRPRLRCGSRLRHQPRRPLFASLTSHALLWEASRSELSRL